MSHAIHSSFKHQLRNYPHFTFKTSKYSDEYLELATWPYSISAQEAKDFLQSKKIEVISLDIDGTEIGELLA